MVSFIPWGRSIPGFSLLLGERHSMQSRPGALWSWGLGVTLVLSLGASGVESLSPADEVSQEDNGAARRRASPLATPTAMARSTPTSS